MERTSFAVVATTCTTLHGSADATIGLDPIKTTTSDDLRGSADTITTTTSDDLRGSADATIGHSRDRTTKRRIGGDASHRHASIIATTKADNQNVLGASLRRLSTTGSGAPASATIILR